MSDYIEGVYYRLRNKKKEPITFHKKATVDFPPPALGARFMRGLNKGGKNDEPVSSEDAQKNANLGSNETPAKPDAPAPKNEDTGGEIIAYVGTNEPIVLRGEQLNQIAEPLDLLQMAREISIKNLNISPDTTYNLVNETARLISIRSDHNEGEAMIIPPFGSRTLNSEILKDYDFADWESQKFVSLERTASGEVENVGAYTLSGLLVIAYGLYLLVSIPLAIFTRITNWGTIGLVSLAALVLIGLSIVFAVRITDDASTRLNKYWTSLWEWLKLSPGMAMVVATGIGLPLAIMYQFGGGKDLLADLAQLSKLSQLPQLTEDLQIVQLTLITRLSQIATLGRLLQISFISIASILPALLYYLFGRQQVRSLTENFYREVMQLDPNVQSRSEARAKYEPLLNSVFDSGNSPLSILLLVISTGLLVMGWVVTLKPTGLLPQDSTNLIEFFTPQKSPFAYGFLGAYYFAINMIFRRYLRADLSPKTYASITVRFLVTLVLVWVVSALPEFATGSIPENILLALVFIIGIFPETGMAIIKDSIKAVLDRFRPPEAQEDFPLTDLEGITVYDRARLLEEGIENIENLAHTNMMEMVASTMLPTQRIVDMFDQAILYLHLNMEHRDSPSTGAGLRDQLKGLGIRSATDLLDAYTDLKMRGETLPIDNIETIVSSMRDDEWLDYIKAWRNSLSRNSEPIKNPYEFHKGSMEAIQDMSASLPVNTSARIDAGTPQVIPASVSQAVPGAG